MSFRSTLVEMTSSLVIPTGTLTEVLWDVVVHDTASAWQADSVGLILVPDNAAWVQLSANLSWDGTLASDDLWMEFRKNGANFAGNCGFMRESTALTNEQSNLLSAPVQVTSGDYFSLHAWHNKGSDQNIRGPANATWFGMELIQ